MTGIVLQGHMFLCLLVLPARLTLINEILKRYEPGLCRPSLPRVFLWSTTVFPCGPLGLLGILLFVLLKHNVQHWVLQCIKSNNCCMQSQNAPESVLGVCGKVDRRVEQLRDQTAGVTRSLSTMLLKQQPKRTRTASNTWRPAYVRRASAQSYLSRSSLLLLLVARSTEDGFCCGRIQLLTGLCTTKASLIDLNMIYSYFMLPGHCN